MEQDNIEHRLLGGNVAAKVVRLGTTVRKPVTPSTPSVEAFLQHLAKTGFIHSPRTLGRDHAGCYVLEFIEGETVSEPGLLTLQELQAIASIIRDLHRASSTFPIPPSSHWEVAIKPDREELICHNDLGAWNLVRRGLDWAFIDWDGSGPSSRLWDLAYAAQSIVHLANGGSPDRDAIRLRAFVDGYELDGSDRIRFTQVLSQRTRASYDLLKHGAQAGIQPWAGIYMRDGDYWRNAADYVEVHEALWTLALT